MDKSNRTMAQQVAFAASAFQQQRTGHPPKSVTAVLNGETLVITLHGALSPAEQALAKSPEGAVQVQEFHRQLFASTADTLREEIKRITGVAVSARGVTIMSGTTDGVKISYHCPVCGHALPHAVTPYCSRDL